MVTIYCCSLNRRLSQHKCATSNIRLRKYIKRIIKAGYCPEIKSLEECRNPLKVFDREVFWINEYNSNGNKTYNIELVGRLPGKMARPKKAPRLKPEFQKKRDEKEAKMNRKLLTKYVY